MKTQYHLIKNVRKLIFFTLILIVLPGFALSASRTSVETKVTTEPIKKEANKQRLSPNQTKGIKKPRIQRAEITNLEIGTYPSGIWFWKATIKNTGNVELDRNLVVQGYKKRVGQNTWVKASKSVIGFGFLPNQTRVYKRKWVRCCRTANLKVELKDNANNTILDTETYFNSLSTTIPQPNGASITQIEWNDTTKQWRATLISGQPWNLKFVVQGYLWHNGLAAPAGGSVVTIGPHGQASTIWFHATGAQNSDTLKVHIKNLMPNCNESNNDCGFEQYRFIVIPNGNSF